MKQLSPILVVHDIEPCLSFWNEGLGFETTATVPHEDKMGFAMLQNGGVQIMYQSYASIASDLPPLADQLIDQVNLLFLEIASIDEYLPKLTDVEVVVPRRQTFYGMDELFVRAPCGTIVGLAAPIDVEESGDEDSGAGN